VFDIDIARCPHCGGALRIIAAIEEPAVIVKILAHLGLASRALHHAHWSGRWRCSRRSESQGQERFCNKAGDAARPAFAQALQLRRNQLPRHDPGLDSPAHE
jgi:hypothetical protein